MDNKLPYAVIFAILAVLSIVMFMNVELTESSKLALMAMTNLLVAISSFLFGVTQTKEK